MSPTKATTAKLRAERTVSDGKKMSSDMQKITGSLSTSNLPKRLGESEGGKGDPADQDSGHFSSDAEGPARPPNLHQATSDDELSMEELRRRQRKERRDYLQRHSPIKGASSRKESPSPGPRYLGERGRRSSDEGTSDTSSVSPPPTPSPKTPRSTSSRPWGPSPGLTLSNRRAKSSGNSPKKLQLGVKSCPYAFGSSQKRFFDDGSPAPSGTGAPQTPSPEGSVLSGVGSDVRRSKTSNISPTSTLQKKPSPLNKSSSDGVQNSIHLSRGSDTALNRSSSDSRVSSNVKREKMIDQTRESWLKFKDDVDSALQKKPNQAGFYKNLADMMHNKMEMLDQVRLDHSYELLHLR
jgi:hypothetical protein